MSARGPAVSRTRSATSVAAMIELTALNTKTNPTPPKIDAPSPPIAGPNSRPPICAAEYSPNASPRRSGGVRSVIVPRAAGSYIAVESPASAAEDDERDGADEHERQELEDARQRAADDHQRHAPRPVRDPAEDRLADEPGGGPRGDDQAERREVHALVAEVERHDREQGPEAEPHDELRDEDREDRRPRVRARSRRTCGRGGQWAWERRS